VGSSPGDPAFPQDFGIADGGSWDDGGSADLGGVDGGGGWDDS